MSNHSYGLRAWSGPVFYWTASMILWKTSLLTADGRLSTGPTQDKAVCLHRGLQLLRRRTRRGRASAALTACICSGRRLLQTAIQFCNCLRDTYMASCFSQNKLLIVLRNVGGKCDIRSRVSCVMSAIQHFHFYVIYKLNCKIFCICKISTTKLQCTINVDIYYLSNENESSASCACATFKCGLGGLRVAKIVGCGARFPSESDAAYLGWAAAEVGSSLLQCSKWCGIAWLFMDVVRAYVVFVYFNCARVV